jgi:hypothetical protein
VPVQLVSHVENSRLTFILADVTLSSGLTLRPRSYLGHPPKLLGRGPVA